jgi:hypothetical protein
MNMYGERAAVFPFTSASIRILRITESRCRVLLCGLGGFST